MKSESRVKPTTLYLVSDISSAILAFKEITDETVKTITLSLGESSPRGEYGYGIVMNTIMRISDFFSRFKKYEIEYNLEVVKKSERHGGWGFAMIYPYTCFTLKEARRVVSEVKRHYARSNLDVKIVDNI